MSRQGQAEDRPTGGRRAIDGLSSPPGAPIILVAEDSPTQAEWLRLALEATGHAVAVTGDGLTALARCRDGDVQLILADVEMPGLDGFELCRQLKEDPVLRRIPVIMLTQRDRVTDVIRALEVGADNYLTKPFPVEELTARVDRLLAEVTAWQRRGRRRHQLAAHTEEIALTFERTQVVEMLMGAAERLETELATVGEIGLGLTMDHSLSELLDIVAARTTQLAEATAVAVALPDEADRWTFVAVNGGSAPFRAELAGVSFPGEPGLAPASSARRDPVVRTHDELADTALGRVLAADPAIGTVLDVPLVVATRLVGMLTIFFAGRRYLPSDEVRRYRTLGDQTTVAIENARLFAREHRSLIELRAVLDAIQDAIVTVDTATDTVEANPAARDLFGASGDLVAERGGEFLPPAIWRLLDDGSAAPAATGELAFERAVGDIRTAEYAVAREYLPGRHLVVLRDVTERRALESRLIQAERLESVGRLAGGVAHDFNNLLNAIGGFAALIHGGLAEGDERRDDAEQIIRAVERAAELTNGLLSFGRRQVLQPTVIDPNSLVESISPLLRRLLGVDIELVSIPRSTGMLLIDPTRFEQVIVNLAVNARDAMPGGGRVTIETEDAVVDPAHLPERVAVEGGRFIMLAVSDTGVGMDARTQSQIFEPFFTTKPRGRGTGLGLATTHGFVSQSGGHIWVYSEPGRGTTFKIYLPRIEEAAQPTEPATPISLPAGGVETILVVEDDEGGRQYVQRTLESFGYTVLAHGDPHEAIELAASGAGRIDLLVTDLLLPGMGGRDLAALVEAHQAGVPTIFISGYTESVAFDRGALAGGARFLAKPFAPSTLAHLVRETLDSTTSPRRGQAG